MVRLSMDNITRIMTKDTNQKQNEQKKKIKLMSVLQTKNSPTNISQHPSSF